MVSPDLQELVHLAVARITCFLLFRIWHCAAERSAPPAALCSAGQPGDGEDARVVHHLVQDDRGAQMIVGKTLLNESIRDG